MTVQFAGTFRRSLTSVDPTPYKQGGRATNFLILGNYLCLLRTVTAKFCVAGSPFDSSTVMI